MTPPGAPPRRSSRSSSRSPIRQRSGAGAHKGHAFFAYATNYLIDLDHAVIVDVEASRAIRQAEVGATRTMIDRAKDRFGLYPQRLAADSAYGSAEMLNWLVNERGTNLSEPTAPSAAPTSRTIARPTPIAAQGASNSGSGRSCTEHRGPSSMKTE
jgi:hypothetical protein